MTTVREVGDMAGKSALVAGATGGLGAAIAVNLADRGMDLTLVSRSAQRLDELAVEGRRLALDLRVPGNCETAVRAAAERGLGVDVVINATGVVAFGSVDELSIDVMEELFLTNSFLPIMLAKAALEHVNEGGVIANISGVIAEKNLPGMAAYGASKAALRSFDEAFSREARRRKVRVLDCRPPHTETGLASRPIEGIAPALPMGLAPELVAAVICDAVAGTVRDLPSEAFA